MNKLTLTDIKLKLPIKPSWKHVLGLIPVRIDGRPIGDTSELDILRVLVFNSMKHHIGIKEVDAQTIPRCDSFIYGYRLKLQNRRFKSVLIALLLIAITLSIVAVLLIAPLPQKLSQALLPIAGWSALVIFLWGTALGIASDLFSEYLWWNKSCSLNGSFTSKEEDPVFLDLPYMVLLAKDSFKQFTPRPLSGLTVFGTEIVENDIKLIEQALFNEMMFVAEQIDEARSKASASLQNSTLPDLETKLYNLISISVHLNLFGSKPEYSLETKKDLCSGIYLRAFLAMHKIRLDKEKGVVPTQS